MQGKSITPQRLLGKAFQKKRMCLSVAVAVFAVILGLGMVWTKRYYASAQVRIYQPQHIAGSMTHELLRVEDRLRTIYEEITSYDFLASVAHDLNMDRGIEPVGTEHQKLIHGMAKHVKLKVKNQDLFRVAYIGRSPQEAKDVTDRIVKKYLENSSRFYEHITSKTESFLETELAQAYKDLRGAQEEVLAYKEANSNVIPEVQLIHMGRKKALDELMLNDRQQYDSLTRQLDIANRVIRKMPSEIILEETVGGISRLEELLEEERKGGILLEALLADFTEEHWQVKDTRQNLKVLSRQIEVEEENRSDTSTKKMGPNPAYVSLSERITQIKLDIGKYETSIKNSSSEKVRLDQYLTEIPKHQLKLERLEQVQSASFARVMMYNKRLSEAKVTSQQDRKGQGPAFEIIDRPRLPIRPYSPSMKKIVVIGFVLSAGAVGAMVCLLTFMDTAVRTIDEARQLIRMPLLGVMQRIITAQEALRLRRRRRRRIIGLSAGATMLAALVIVSFLFWQEPIKGGVDKISRYLSGGH